MNSFTLTASFTAAVAAIAAYNIWYIEKRNFPHLPTPWPHFFTTNLSDVLDPSFPHRLHTLKTPVFVTLPGMPQPVLMVIDPLLAKHLLGKCSTRPLIGDPSFTTLFGAKSIFRAVGHEHRRIRSLCAKAFSKASLGFHFDRLRRLARETAAALAEASQGLLEGVDPMPFMQAYSYRAVCVFLVGQSPEYAARLEALEQDFIVFSTGFLAEFRPRWVDYFTGNKIPKARAARSRILLVCQKMAQERRAAMSQGEVFTDSLSAFIDSKDVSGNSFSDLEIAELFLDLLFAGFETTSKQLATVFHHLVYSLSDRDRAAIREEVFKTVDLFDSEQAFGSLGVQLEAFIKESMRVFPVLPAPTRILLQDTTLNGVHVPAGTIIDAVREQGLFLPSNPEEFSLGHFLGDQAFDKLHPTEFIPFGMGEGMCLAFQLAKLEMKLLVAEVIRSYDIRKDETAAVVVTCFPSKVISSRVILTKV
ncbi:cytochrome P450 [Obelidium mucronatum]|nr:cytochrome P450 [Obelidium mucronatum]